MIKKAKIIKHQLIVKSFNEKINEYTNKSKRAKLIT